MRTISKSINKIYLFSSIIFVLTISSCTSSKFILVEGIENGKRRNVSIGKSLGFITESDTIKSHYYSDSTYEKGVFSWDPAGMWFLDDIDTLNKTITIINNFKDKKLTVNISKIEYLEFRKEDNSSYREFFAWTFIFSAPAGIGILLSNHYANARRDGLLLLAPTVYLFTTRGWLEDKKYRIIKLVEK
jgi:hypothetical protein